MGLSSKDSQAIDNLSNRIQSEVNELEKIVNGSLFLPGNTANSALVSASLHQVKGQIRLIRSATINLQDMIHRLDQRVTMMDAQDKNKNMQQQQKDHPGITTYGGGQLSPGITRIGVKKEEGEQ